MSKNFCATVVCVLLAASFALAQDRGTITGTISDTTGAAVPGATVVLRHPETGLSQQSVSGTDGGYSFIYLSAGKYTLTVEMAGFRKAEVPEVRVSVNTASRVDVQLQVGEVTEIVEVTAGATLLQTDRSDLGKVVDNQAIQKLPLFMNGGLRSNLAFAGLNPGVQMNLTNDPDTTTGSPIIAGGRQVGASMLVDGAESMSERRNDPAMRVVSAEAIEEFKVQSGAYSAEYGRSSNGILNYTTKSGTNSLHGSFLVQHRNEHLNADGFFYGPHRDSIQRQNLQAAYVGGPIYIPKLYDGRNKAFFFFAGERSRYKNLASQDLITLPIQDFRNGDFRRYTNAAGQMIPLYDPFDANGNIIANANVRPLLQCNGVQNVICPERISPVARAIQAYLPLPDNPDVVFNNTTARFNGSRVPGANNGVYSIKGDYIATDRLRFNGLFSRQYFDSPPLIGPIPGPLAEAFQEFGVTKYYRLNTDYVIHPNLLNHFTFGVNLRDLGEGPVLGLDDAYRQATLMPGVSADKAPNYTKYNTEFGNFGGHVNTISPGRTFSFGDQMAWLKGRHSMKFGFQFSRVNYRRIDCNNCVGTITMGAVGTAGAAATGNPGVSGTTGSSYAAFLLGLARDGVFNYGADINFIFKYYAWYFQDDIKINNKLTLNVGLRYDLAFPRLEGDRQNSNFNPTLPNPAAGGLPGALEFAGTGPGRSGNDRLQDVRKNGFGPRLGFAYQVTPKTVLRAGGSMIYDSIREDNNADTGIQGFGGSFNAPPNSLSNGISFLFKNGFLQFPDLVEASRPPKIDPSLANFQSASYKSREAGKPGYFVDYNFTLEQSLTENTLWRTSFHANYGVKLQVTQNFNQLDPTYFPIYGTLLSTPLSTAMNDPRVIASGFRLPYPAYPTNFQLQQALRPFPQYTGVSGTSLTGHSTYNALETSFEHRFSKGLWALVSYTFSKYLESVEGANVYVNLTDKVVASRDTPQILVMSYVYDLPFGKGRALGSGMHPVWNGILGNWTISGVHRYQSGNPVGITSSQNLFGAGNPRPHYVYGEAFRNASWNPDDPNSSYINPAAFVQPANMVYGTAAARIPQLRTPSQLNEDVAMSKTFYLGRESTNLEFRASAFNLANRHLLGGLNTNVTSATFGRFSNPQSNQPRNIQFSLRLTF
jgi:Carboxypeptidase regulatory-like domain/TonB dependent receptor-like, beta-barrel/TonB-dependent Receptor Plug Domain